MSTYVFIILDRIILVVFLRCVLLGDRPIDKLVYIDRAGVRKKTLLMNSMKNHQKGILNTRTCEHQ